MTQCDRDPRLAEIVFVHEVRLLGLVDRDRAESQTITRFELRDQWKIDGGDFTNARIAARRLAVGHQYDRHAVWRKLHGPEGDAFRQKLHGVS